MDDNQVIYNCSCGWTGLSVDLLCGPRGTPICPNDTIISRHNNLEDSEYWEELSDYYEENDLDPENDLDFDD